MRLMNAAMCAALMAAGGLPPAAADFAVQDGDVVVFLGDSITAAREYGKIIEQYTLLRYPARKARFINAGWGGDTAAGGLARLERDVFSRKATLLTVAYGVNDIGWGGKADDEHKQKYLDGVKGIVLKCKERGVRVYICSAAVTGADPDTSENDYLQKMCDEGMALSRSLGGGAIDVQRTMRGIQKRVKAANAQAKTEKEKRTLHAEDGIHLNDLGQLAMAFAILKGLGAPADVSSAVVGADGPKVLEAAGCKVTALEGGKDRVAFTRLDEGLPLNNGLFWPLMNFLFIPIPEELNRYMLTVKDLDPGRYEVRVDERAVGTFSREQLAAGVNLSSATADGWAPGGPWAAQAWLLKMPTDARNELDNARKLSGEYLKTNPDRPAADEQAGRIIAEVEALQRLIARPAPYRFVISKVK